MFDVASVSIENDAFRTLNILYLKNNIEQNNYIDFGDIALSLIFILKFC